MFKVHLLPKTSFFFFDVPCQFNHTLGLVVRQQRVFVLKYIRTYMVNDKNDQLDIDDKAFTCSASIYHVPTYSKLTKVQ